MIMMNKSHRSQSQKYDERLKNYEDRPIAQSQFWSHSSLLKIHSLGCVISIIIVSIVFSALWYIYLHNVHDRPRNAPRELPVITSEGSIKTKPVDEEGKVIPYRKRMVFSEINHSGGSASLFISPTTTEEKPNINDLLQKKESQPKEDSHGSDATVESQEKENNHPDKENLSTHQNPQTVPITESHQTHEAPKESPLQFLNNENAGTKISVPNEIKMIIQVGAFKSHQAAEKKITQLPSLNKPFTWVIQESKINHDQSVYRVVSTPLPKKEAEYFCQTFLKSKQIPYFVYEADRPQEIRRKNNKK